MKKTVHSLLSRLPTVWLQLRGLPLRDLSIGLVTVAAGLFVARLIVTDLWHIAAVVIFIAPAVILLQRFPFLSIIAWLVFAPFLMDTTSAWERQVYWVIHRALPVLGLLVILLPSALGISEKNLPKLGFPEAAMAVYAVAGMTSIWMINLTPLATTYQFYDRVIIPMCLYLIIRLSSPNEGMIRWLIPVMLFIALSQSIIGTISWISPSALPAKWVDYENQRTIGTLINTNAYITTLVLSGFLSLHYGLQLAAGRIRTLSIVTFLLTVYCIFIAFSRAGWLAGFLALCGLFYIYPKFVMRLVMFIIPVFILIGGIFLQNQISWAKERLWSEGSENSALSRVPVFAAALRMYSAKPLNGWGYGNFDRFDRQFQTPPVANIHGDSRDHASHNFFLSMLAEQGTIGILSYLGPAFYWLALTLKNFTRLPKDGFWSRKVLVIFWMVILSHFIVYNFANMRVVFGLGNWWLTLGLIALFMDSHQRLLVANQPQLTALNQWGRAPRKREQVYGYEQSADSQ